MNKRHPEPCPSCTKEIFPNNDFSILYEDYANTIPHSSFKCQNFKNLKKKFEKIEDSIQNLRLQVNEIQGILF